MMSQKEEEEEDFYPFADSSDDEGQSFRHMSREEWKTYIKQVNESDGFEVDGIPDVHELHQIQPILDKETENCILYSKIAIDKFNNSEFKIKEGELEFNQFLMATGQVVCGKMYYLTFNAKNLAMGGEIRTYQAIVLQSMGKIKELSFRRKPSGPKKDWFWGEDECASGCC